MKYRYLGVTKQNEQVSGVVEAQDEVEARMRLRAMQVRPLKLAQHRESRFSEGWSISITPPVGLKAMAVFTRQFSSLIDSGVPVAQCLQILVAQEHRGVFKDILENVRQDIEGGASLADALSKYPRVFSDFFVRIVEAGEMSGTLDTALRRAGNQLEKLGKLRSKVIGAITYPIFTMVASIGLLIIMLVKVIPSISSLYGDAKASLPSLTVNVLAFSKWFQDNINLILLSIAAAVASLFVLYRMRAFREIWDPIVLKIPLFGSLLLKSAVARCARTMATLVASGVPLLTSFDICIRLMDNIAIKKALANAANSISEGKSMAVGLAQGRVFPMMVIHMVNVGEMTGRLDDLLNKVADIYDDEVDDAVQNLTGLLQPMLIIVVGAMVAFLLLAMYLPIFQLAEKITGGL